MADLTLGQIAESVGGRGVGDPALRLSGVAPLESAEAGDLSFVASPRYLHQLEASQAGAVLLPQTLGGSLPEGRAAILVEDPYVALARILPRFYPERRPPPGVDPTAVIGDAVVLGEAVRIEAYAVIGDRTEIGDGVRIGAGVVVGDGCIIGTGSVLHPHVTLYPGVRIGARCVVHSGARLGGDGFRFVFDHGGHRKVPHVGGCVIGDDVEIGANSAVDRGSIGDTVVGDGSKLDNLVHIGHNVRLGRHVLVVAQVGISGSVDVGDGAVLGGQVGVNPHVSIGSGARVGGRSVVISDVAPGETVSGYPARGHRESMKAQAALFRLPGLMKRVQEIERAVFGPRKNEERRRPSDHTREE